MSLSLSEAFAKTDLVRSEVKKRIIGQEKLIDRLLITLLSGGHMILE